MNEIIHAELRPARKGVNKLRREGKIPANIYGYNITSTPIVVDYKEMTKAVQKYGQSSVFTIDLQGKKINAIVNEVQRCAIRRNVKHIDFLSVNMDKKIEVEIPIRPVGESIGVKEGGVLTLSTHMLTVKVKPSEMPEFIEVDISNLKINESLTVADIRNTVSYELLNSDEDVIVAITPPASEPSDAIDPNPNDPKEPIAIETPEAQG